MTFIENNEPGDGRVLLSGMRSRPPCSPLLFQPLLFTVQDNDTAELSVDATPACGTTVTDSSVTPSFVKVLTPAPGEEVETEYRWVTDSTAGRWLPAQPIEPGGRSIRTSFGTFAQLRQAYVGFAGFEYRLTDTPSLTARCTWQFDDDDRGGTTTTTTAVRRPPCRCRPPRTRSMRARR